MYFPFSILKSGRKRSAHSRRRFIQSFPYPADRLWHLSAGFCTWIYDNPHLN